MTICIAAHCFSAQKIILVSDTMISTGSMTSEWAALKFRWIAQHWCVQFAGNDISGVIPLLDDVADKLAGEEDSRRHVEAAFIAAFQKQLRIKAETEVLGGFGYTLQDFRSKGLQELGPDLFTRLAYALENLSIDSEFLVAGFDKGEPRIFTVQSPGKLNDYSAMGFWAIGSGQTNALGSLFNVHTRSLDLQDKVYRVLEAKFNAESALGVGKATVGTIISSNGARYSLLISGIDPIRNQWEKTRVLEVPSATSVMVSTFLEESEQAYSASVGIKKSRQASSQ